MRKKLSIPKLKKKLDSIFSKFIRYSHSPDGETVACYTCGVVKPIKEMHNGHHISRAISPTRYHESNCRPQCPACNTFKEGMQHIFARNLRVEIGEDAYEALIRESQTRGFKWDRCRLEADIEYYTALNRELGAH